MAKTKEQFIQEGRDRYNSAYSVRGLDSDAVINRGSFMDGSSWQAQAFALGWRQARDVAVTARATLQHQGTVTGTVDMGPRLDQVPKARSTTGVLIVKGREAGRAVLHLDTERFTLFAPGTPHSTAQGQHNREQRIASILRGFEECAIWADGEDLDGADDIHPESHEAARQFCADFYDAMHVDLGAYAAAQSYDAAGHDLWLTVNGHGAGFWGRGLGGIGKRLSAVCGHGKRFQPVELFVDDSGRVCFSFGYHQTGVTFTMPSGDRDTLAQVLGVQTFAQGGDHGQH